jgi:uncharacterized membrane protein
MKDFLQGKWLKHPLHPMLVHIPTALWPAALVFDILSNFGVGGNANAMVQTSFYAIAFGLAAALAAIPTGLADWWDIKPDKPARKIGLYHLALNLTITALQILNLLLRLGTLALDTAVAGLPLALSVISTLLLGASSYLGGLMVFDYGISVARLSKKRWRKIAEESGANVPSEERGEA